MGSLKLTSHLRKIKSKASLTGAPGVLYLWWIMWGLRTEKMNSFSSCLLLHSLHLSVLPLCGMFSQDSWEPCLALLRFFLSTGYFSGLLRCSLSFLALLFAYFPLSLLFSPALPPAGFAVCSHWGFFLTSLPFSVPGFFLGSSFAWGSPVLFPLSRCALSICC